MQRKVNVIGLLYDSKYLAISLVELKAMIFVISTQPNLFGIRTKQGAYTSISNDGYGDECE